ncbi:hypothetical protein [Ewingella americana]|jgi:hypothetical protein|uniref:Uncharacterized protein n=1 Tax=Ewingella americana TaxID=41202 RepID=A0A502GKD0_9GAMM|nr:hypothetical protein [Ewingella americana]TPG61820.1 hypothetical protein EAH77_10175 [Ewingella americana]
MKTPDFIPLSASFTLTITLRALSFFGAHLFMLQFILMQKQCLLPAQSVHEPATPETGLCNQRNKNHDSQTKPILSVSFTPAENSTENHKNYS